MTSACKPLCRSCFDRSAATIRAAPTRAIRLIRGAALALLPLLPLEHHAAYAARSPSTAGAAPRAYIVPRALTHERVAAPLQVLREGATRLGAAAVAALPDARFSPARDNLGAQDGAVWMRIPLERVPQSTSQLVVQLGRPLWREADAYLVTGNGAGGGAGRVERLAPLPTRLAAFALSPPDGPSLLLLRVSQYGAITPVVRLWNAADFRRYSDDDALLQGLFFGMMLALLIYNGFLFAGTRDKVHLAYIAWQSATLFYVLGSTGLGQSQIWPGMPTWNDVSLYAGLMLSCAGGLLCARTYLLLPEFAPRIDQALQIVQWLALTLAVIEVVPHNAWLSIPTQAIAAATLLLAAVAAAVRWRQGFVPAAILLVGLVPLIVVGYANIGRYLGWLPETFLTTDALQWVLALLALVLTYGLSVRVARLHERAARLQELLLKDPLTGLFNRNGLFDQGERVLDRTRSSHATAAVLWVDLDGLKRINDHFGHAAGDALIQATAARLRDAFGPDAVCARLGGDEFGIVLPNLPSTRLAVDLANHALERLRAPYALSGQEFRASGSIGVALYPRHALTLEELLRLADVAMYRAKSHGRDTQVLWEPGIDAGAQSAPFRFALPPRSA